MAQIIGLPKLSPTMEEGVLVRWTKKVGDKVSPGDLVAEVETDKANMDFPLEEDGVLLKQLATAGQTVRLGAPVAILGDAGEDISGLLAELAGGGKAEAPASAAPAKAAGQKAEAPASAEPADDAADPERPDVAAERPKQAAKGAEAAAPAAKGGGQATPAGAGQASGQAAPASKAAGQAVAKQAPPATASAAPAKGVAAPVPKESPVAPPPGAPIESRSAASPLARRLAGDAGLDIRTVAGSGPGVIIIHEIPGITPEVARFARWVRDAGFTVYLPSLFGKPGKPNSKGYTNASIFRVLCIAREFKILAANEHSPVVDWLKQLAAQAHRESGGKGVGALGMCLTGNFAISMMVEPSVLAPVLCQPAQGTSGSQKRGSISKAPSTSE